MYGEGFSGWSGIIIGGIALLFLFIFSGGAERSINATKKRWSNLPFWLKKTLHWIAIPCYFLFVIYVYFYTD